MRRIGLGILTATAVAYIWFSDSTTSLGLTVSTLLSIAAICVTILTVLAEGKMPAGKGFMQLEIISIALLFWAFIVYLINWSDPAVIRRLGQIALGISMANSVYIMINTYSRIRIFIICLIIAVFVSAFVGIGQHFIGEPFITLWLASGQDIENQLNNVRILIPGLAPTSILLGYQLAAAVPLVAALLLSGQYAVSKRWKAFFLIALITMSLALVLCGSRSALAGAAFGAAFTAFLMRSRGRKVYVRTFVLAGLIMATSYLAIGYLYSPFRFIRLMDFSAATRFPLAVVAIRNALDHPLGSGIYKPLASYLPSNLDPRVAEAVLNYTPHNQFLNILVYYGFPGLFLLILFYWIVFAELQKMRQMIVSEQDEHLKWVVAGLYGAVLGYLLNSIFHNAGPFVGDWYHWFIIGLIFSTRRAYAHRKKVLEVSSSICKVFS
jgi:hypothetical protein